MDFTTGSTVEALRTAAVPIMLVLDALAIGYTAWVLRRGGASRAFIGWAAFALAGWLAILHVLLGARWPLPIDIGGIAFFAVILAGVGLFGAAIRFTPAWSVLRSASPETLMLAQGIRILFGAGFLVHAAIGLLPMGFGLVDGLSHITAGAVALLALAVPRTAASRRTAMIGANLFGLLDILVVASTIALVLLPELTPYHPMMYAVFLPAPIWLWLHLLSLLALRRAPESAAAAPR